MSNITFLVLSILGWYSVVAQRLTEQPSGDWRHYVSMCIIFKDEAAFLKEWIEFHRLVGVDKFYMYSNDSKDKFKKVLQPYTESGLVTLIEWESQKQTQCSAYAHCLREFGADSRWMGFFDVDEYVFPTDDSHDTLWPVLQQFEQYGGLVVRNALYGSSGYINQPKGLVTENYAFRAPLDHPTFAEDEDDVIFHVKSFVDARHGIGCGKYGAHVIFFDDPEKYWLVNARGEKHQLNGKHAPKGMAYVDLIRYNHYKCKSKQDWDEKKAKGTVQGAPAAKKFAKKGNLWPNVNRNDVLDESIYRFLPALREAMGLEEHQYAMG